MEFGRETGEVIVLLHGGGLSWWNYREAAGQLADRFHVVLPILDGHAGSQMPFHTIEECAGRIIDFIDERFGGHILLLGGVSLGAQVAVEILSQRSTVCDYAVIESALTQPLMERAWIGPAFSLSYPLIRRRWFARLQFRWLRIMPGLFEEYYHDTSRIARADLIAFMEANAGYRLKPSIADCKAKTLVLAGAKERPAVKASARMLAQIIPRSGCEILKGLGHGELSMNHADRYVEKMLRLMDR